MSEIEHPTDPSTPTDPATGTGREVGIAATEWPIWSTTARLVLLDGRRLDEARALVEAELDRVARACSRFRDDAEIMRLAAAGGAPVVVSETLLDLVQAALAAAVATAGAVDPTLGSAMTRLGYDRDIAQLRTHGRFGATVRLVAAAAPGWQRVAVDRAAGTIAVPADVVLDLGATAKAWAADRCARLVAQRLGTGVLVGLGGDIATAGPAPDGWTISVQDLPDDPAALVRIPAGCGVATSSTRRRRWVVEGRELNHILDPATSLPVDDVWGAVTVVAPSCVAANTWSTAAMVRGRGAPGMLAAQRLPARLVSRDGQDVVFAGGWPGDAETGPSEPRGHAG